MLDLHWLVLDNHTNIHIPQEWQRIDPASLKGTVMVIGRSDTGKTTLARYLYHQLCGHCGKVGFLDCDVGQSTLGLPTTMTLTLSATDEEPGFPPQGEAFSYFIGSTSPRGHMLPTVVGARKLQAKAQEMGAEDRDGVLAYRMIQPPPRGDFAIDFGLEETEMYRGEGWSWNEEIGGLSANWATAQRAQVFVPLRQGGNYKLTIAALPFSYQGAPPQKVKITMNGHPVSELSLTANWAPYRVDIPSTVTRYGLNELTLHSSHLASPQDVLPENSDQRTLAVAVDYVKLEHVNGSPP
jgi:Predicted GTPase or GTP-binding protein